MFKDRYTYLLKKIERLEERVSNLEARLNSLEYRDAAGVGSDEAKPDPVQERYNRLFNEGLDNLFSFDGRVKKEDEHAEA